MDKLKRSSDYVKLLTDMGATVVVLYLFIHVIEWIVNSYAQLLDKCVK